MFCGAKMALNGSKNLGERITEFLNIYTNFRINIFRNAYPEFKQDPKKLEPSLRNELRYFLNKLDILENEVEYNDDNSQDTLKEIEHFKVFLTDWQLCTKPQNDEVELDDQNDQELQFRLDM